MRKVMYKVRDDYNFRIFTTASYAEATAKGCKIIDTFLVPVSVNILKTDKELEKIEKEKERLFKITGRKFYTMNDIM